MIVHHTLTAPSRFHDVRFCYFPIDAADPSQREYMLVACEDGKTRIFDVTSNAEVQATEDEDRPVLEPFAQLSGHVNR
jgi:protein MAK11